ncbi:MAG TPA: hypothetical protein VGG71_01655 [Chitinophagaceae bacterium]|jgi:hypothetical protein
MKKIFTLVFSLGLLTAAFAQNGQHQGNENRNGNSDKQSYAYQGDHHKYSNDQGHQTSPYSNSDNWNYQSKDRKSEDRYDSKDNRNGYGDRNDIRDQSGERRIDDNKIHSRHLPTHRQSHLIFSFGRSY